jgi:hypothetical protein
MGVFGRLGGSTTGWKIAVCFQHVWNQIRTLCQGSKQWSQTDVIIFAPWPCHVCSLRGTMESKNHLIYAGTGSSFWPWVKAMLMGANQRRRRGSGMEVGSMWKDWGERPSLSGYVHPWKTMFYQ